MPIKKVPVCPICGKDMTYQNLVQVPTSVETPQIEMENKRIPLMSSGLNSQKIITDYIVLYMWKCSECSFVAFFESFLG